ncbi:50S ribosomal protein L23 [Phaeodactylibacter luteus]|uniref:Large ribosomal subunit protein uL23 n=1 Tax=Phaeodactylibacter luteus TaxID=1564516 RepID=A0A5C6RII8_9BACT|nr:50S ribosomal protein L23 [Phaeodactylibacter luteus]TXB61933.1 50S ribosomal protein L23 [Phaeodactylibacter luteus]
MAKTILVKPLITEKTERLSDQLGKYTFVVNKDANKIEIKKAIEDMYQVTVEEVKTLIMPAKTKNRSTRSGILTGRKAAFKKAVVTLADGEEIDFYGDI